MTARERLYLGVDCGATKTLAVVVDEAGEERGRASAAGANPAAIGFAGALEHVHAAVTAAVRAAGGELPVAGAWFGLAGFDRPEDHALWTPHLAPLAGALRLTNDGELTLTALDGSVGVGLISGTGSIGFGRDAAGGATRAGGWGHVFGDEGSGWEIGRRALQAVARAHDGRGPSTLLTQAVTEFWNLPGPEGMIGRVYPIPDKALVASLSGVVLSTARAGDPVAIEIRDREAEEIALLALTLGDALSFPRELPLALAGGLLVNEGDFRAAVLERIREKRTLGQVAVVRDAPLSAARAARGGAFTGGAVQLGTRTEHGA